MSAVARVCEWEDRLGVRAGGGGGGGGGDEELLSSVLIYACLHQYRRRVWLQFGAT